VVCGCLGPVEEASEDSARVDDLGVKKLAVFMCLELFLDRHTEVTGEGLRRDVCSAEPRELSPYRDA